jgi:hypothetical protein
MAPLEACAATFRFPSAEPCRIVLVYRADKETRAMTPTIIYLLMFASVAGMFLLTAAVIAFVGRLPADAQTAQTPSRVAGAG